MGEPNWSEVGPELLEALLDLYNALDSCIELTPKVLAKARAALAKARGE